MTMYLKEKKRLILFTSNFSGGASGKFGAHIRIISARQIAEYNCTSARSCE